MRKYSPVAAVIGICAVAAAVVLLSRTSGAFRRHAPREAIGVHYLSIAIDRYEMEHGHTPALGTDPNRELATELLRDGLISEKHVVDGLLLDEWGTPYAVLIRGGEPFSWNGKKVDTYITGLRYPPTHQVISAGRDREFGPGGKWTPGEGPWAPGQPGWDDIGSWQDGPLGSEPES